MPSSLLFDFLSQDEEQVGLSQASPLHSSTTTYLAAWSRIFLKILIGFTLDINSDKNASFTMQQLIFFQSIS